MMIEYCLFQFYEANLPFIKYSILIDSHLKLKITSNNEIVAIEKVIKLKGESLQYFSQLVEVFDTLDKFSNASNIKRATQIWVNELENEEENKDYEEMDDDLKIKLLKLKFNIEQLQLMEKSKFGRWYSPDLLSLAFIWNAQSPAVYRTILKSAVLSLPSSHHLCDFIDRWVTWLKGLDFLVEKYIELLKILLNLR